MPRLRLSVAVLLLAMAAAHTLAATRHWSANTSGELWHDAANWSGGLPPGELDNAWFGVLPGVDNATAVVEQFAVVDSLLIRDGMTVQNTPGSGGMSVVHTTNIVDENLEGVLYHSTLRLFPSAIFPTFTTHDLLVQEGGRVDLRDGAEAYVFGTLTTIGPNNSQTEGTVMGQGRLTMNGDGTTLNNNGTIDPVGALVFEQIGDGLYDLDGFGENGRVVLTGNLGGAYDSFLLSGNALTDDFSGKIILRTGRSLTMDLSEGWTADENSKITVAGDSPTNNGPAKIWGSPLTLAGEVDMTGAGIRPWLQIEADVTFQPTATVALNPESVLSLQAEAVVNGGEFVLSENTSLGFQASTLVRGGTFITTDGGGNEPQVLFIGDTEWDGIVSFTGTARQQGDATVTGQTVIDAESFDMDGATYLPEARPHWQVNSTLVINAETIDFSEGNRFAGTVAVAGGFLGRLAINLSDPAEGWEMAGEMSLDNSLPFGATRLAGSSVRFTGGLNVSGSVVGIDADAVLAAGGVTRFETPGSSLAMQATSRVEAEALFSGQGSLINSTNGHMTLDDGAVTDGVGLGNAGLLDIDDAIGIATVDRFENDATGVLSVDLAGHLLGEEFDHLMVAGTADLDGALAVELLLDDLGAPLFLPALGDEFMILTSLEGVNGEFADVLPTIAGGMVYGWEALYHPHDVTIRLASVGAVPEPAAALLLVIGVAVGAAARRR